jgi:ABC-2 type transport system ATP-binding protein
LILLDEPTSGLDPQARRDLHVEILNMRQDRRTVLLTTHHLDEAEELCDRVAIIDHGEIVATGTPRDLMARSSAMQTIVVVTSPPIDRMLVQALPGVETVQDQGNQLRVTSSRVGETVTHLMRLIESLGLELTGLHVQKATLEDVFIELTGAALRD